jgi:hypothetical protein
VDHEDLHGGAYGRTAAGDLQIPPREPHTMQTLALNSDATASRGFVKVRSTSHRMSETE